MPVAIGALVLVSLAYLTITNPPKAFDIRFVIAPLFGLFMLFSPLFLRREQRKLYDRSMNLHGQLSVDLAEEGLTFSGPTFKSEILWPHFLGFAEDERTLLIFSSPQTFHILPKRRVESNQLVALLEALSSNVERIQ